MKYLICTAAIALMGALSPLPATAQTAATILQEMQATQTAQAANVPLYVTRTNAGIVGAPTQTLLFRALETNSGTTTYTMVLPDEIQSMLNEQGYKTTDVLVDTITIGSLLGLDGIRNSGRDDSAEMADAFLDNFGGFLSPLADYRDFEELQYAEENDRMDASVDQMEFEQFMSKANYVGLTDVRGAQAYHLRAENIGMQQVTPDGEYTFETIDFYVEQARKLPLGFAVSGTAKMPDGKTVPLLIQSDYRDYFNVGGSALMLPRFTDMSFDMDMMDPKQKAEMAQAKKEMDKAMAELKNAPPAVRAMVERQLAGQMAMFDGMAAGEPVKVTTEIIAAFPATSMDEALLIYMEQTPGYAALLAE